MNSHLGVLLNPLRENIKDFHRDVRTQNAEFKGQMEQFVRIHKNLSSSTDSLTRAMRGDVKSQGHWGEMILEKILEASGLREGEEYILHGKGLGLRSEEGGLLKPDAIVLLPENRCLVVDAKVSLKHYAEHEDALNNNDPQAAQVAKQKHSEAVLNHVKALSERDYTQAKLRTPDFVYMFMPNDGSLVLATQTYRDLSERAWKLRVIPVSPTTLLSCLQITASIWRVERQNTNAQEIARQAGALYDKVVGFVDDIKDIGNALGKASTAQEDALSKLSQGKGNLIGRVEKLKELGVPAKKSLN